MFRRRSSHSPFQPTLNVAWRKIVGAVALIFEQGKAAHPRFLAIGFERLDYFLGQWNAGYSFTMILSMFYFLPIRSLLALPVNSSALCVATNKPTLKPAEIRHS